MLNPFLKNVMGIENYESIKHILVTLIPFYFAVIECNARGMEIYYADEKHKKQNFVSAVNSFHLDGMKARICEFL